MRSLDIDDRAEGWRSVAKKLSMKLARPKKGKITHRHLYRDNNGDPYYLFYRYENGEGKFMRCLEPRPRAGLRGAKRILYNLPDVLKANVVIITEGEKKADIVAKLELLDANGNPVVVTTSGGAGSWHPRFAEFLLRKKVIIFPDTDSAGRCYCQQIIGSLELNGIDYQCVSFDAWGKDVRDFLKSCPGYGVRTDLLTFIDSDWLQRIQPEESLGGPEISERLVTI